MKRLALILTLVIFSAASLGADVYIKSKTHTDPFEMMGQSQPAKDEVTEQWIGNNTFATSSSRQNMVIDLNKQVMYIIYPQSQSYVEASLPLDMTKLLPEQIAQMMAMFKVTAKVTANGQTKKIGQWNCAGYDVEMNMTGMMPMTMNMKTWATTDVPFDWKNYMDKMLPTVMKASSVNMPFGEDVLNEFKKIEGYQVAAEMTMTMMGTTLRIITEVEEISEKPAPAGIYAVPAGYKKQDKLTLQQDF
jgi:hypothetical protein